MGNDDSPYSLVTQKWLARWTAILEWLVWPHPHERGLSMSSGWLRKQNPQFTKRRSAWQRLMKWWKRKEAKK